METTLKGNGASAPHADAESSALKHDKRSEQAMRVMLVDDQADVLASLGRLLRALGYDVRGAGDGLEALSCAETFRPDVALIDLSRHAAHRHDRLGH